MFWFKRLIIGLASLVLLISLVGLAASYSLDSNLTHESKISAWLNQSNLYGGFINKAVNDAQQALVGYSQSSQIGSTVEQSAEAVYPRSIFNSNVDSILKANYAWLEGHTAAPSFRIDLASYKQAFANNLAANIQSQISSMPGCSAAQMLQLSSTSPFNLTCKPVGVSLSSISTQVVNQVEASDIFLSNTVITPQSINANNNNTAKAYYLKLARAPKAYQWVGKLPWIFGAVAVICVLFIMFISRRKRKGLRLVSLTLLISGLLLVLAKAGSRSLTNRLDAHVTNSASLGALATPLVNFVHYMVNAVMKTYQDFGIAYIVLGLLMLIVLWLFAKIKRHHKQPKPTPKNTSQQESASMLRLSLKKPRRSIDIISLDSDSSVPEPTTAPPLEKSSTKRRLQ